MRNSFDSLDISTRLIHMPKTCPYNLKDYIYTYAEQMHRVFGLIRNNRYRCKKRSLT